MNEQELAQAIRDYIKTIYNAEYIGLLSVEKFNPGYKMTIGIPSYMIPTSIACDYDNDDDFLNYIYLELKTRNYIRQDVYKVIRTSQSKEE